MVSHLYVVLFDLANAFGSVPHSLLWAAFDYLSVPKAIEDIGQGHRAMPDYRGVHHRIATSVGGNYGRMQHLPTCLHNGYGGHHPCFMLGGRWREAQTWSTHPSHQSIYGRYDQVSPGAYQSSRGSCQSTASTSGKNPYQHVCVDSHSPRSWYPKA